jgi:hypothetical protein
VCKFPQRGSVPAGVCPYGALSFLVVDVLLAYYYVKHSRLYSHLLGWAEI